MTTAAAWQKIPSALPEKISTLLSASGDPALDCLSLVVAFPEWEVPLPFGTSSSMTDVMAITRNDHGLCTIAVEAKVDESFGPSVAEKKDYGSENVFKRIMKLEEHLKANAPFAGDIRYQLLHRTASALITAEQFHAKTAVMLVQSFCNKGTRRESFDLFVSSMKAEQSKGSPNVYRVPGFDAPSLYLAWSGWTSSDDQFLKTDYKDMSTLDPVRQVFPRGRIAEEADKLTASK